MKNPKIRFKGFTEVWEQRKLGEVAKYRNGKAHENDISEDGKYFVVNSKFVSTDGKVKKFSNQQIEPLYKGELAFVLSDVPNGRAIARTFLVDKDDKYSLNQRIAGITPLDKTDSYFLHILMNRHPYFLRFDDGAKQTNLSVNDVMEFETYYPSFDEQAKIGVYFLTLDNLITLHQRKCDETKILKKYMLQKMFPQNGSDVPEIRFSGFTNAWEQRKLGDEAIEILAGGDIDKSKVVEVGKYPIYANALTNDGIMGYYNDYFRVKAPAVTVTGRGDVGHAQSRMIDFTPVVRLLAIRSNHDSYFLENVINNHKTVVESTGVPQLTVPQLASYDISFPTNINEEIKIGEFFHNLDNLITLHQRKCDELKEIKKSMLQNMFV